MSAETKTILSVEVVTDHDCGNYHIGELDFRIHSGALQEYLRKYRYEGQKNLFAMLGHLSYAIGVEFGRTDLGYEAAGSTSECTKTAQTDQSNVRGGSPMIPSNELGRIGEG